MVSTIIFPSYPIRCTGNIRDKTVVIIEYIIAVAIDPQQRYFTDTVGYGSIARQGIGQHAFVCGEKLDTCYRNRAEKLPDALRGNFKESVFHDGRFI